MDSRGNITHILEAMERGDLDAEHQLLPLIYDELHGIAHRKISLERPGQTLQATALVHEAYLRLFGQSQLRWKNRRHFFAAAAEAMRRILVENARKKGRIKRGGDRFRVDVECSPARIEDRSEDLLDLDDALRAFSAESPRRAELVKLRYFAGLSLQDAARCLGISRATADRYWSFARAWLYDRLHGTRGEDP